MTNLPPNPSIENLKKQAKTLKKAWEAADARALQRVRTNHPKCAAAPGADPRAVQPRLTDCQLVLARECGFDSWRQLKAAVQTANQDLPQQFVSLACLCYDDPHFDHRSFHRHAHDMLRRNPWLAEADIWCAAVAGNAAAVEAFTNAEPALLNRPGPHGWVPLICACYSRVQSSHPANDTFASAKVLLDRGADPNAFIMKGNADERLDQTARCFTALTGVFGGGSTGMANEPAHPHWRELAELLLERGANPNDETTVEIYQDPEITYAKLEMLIRHGLEPDAVAQRADSGGISLMGRALCAAIFAGDAATLKLLLAHGARTGEIFRGKTPWQHAMSRGHLDMAHALEAAGAPVRALDDLDLFVSRALAGDVGGVRALLERSPDLLSRSPQQLVLKAASGGRIDAVNLVLDLGFDPDYMDEVTALHQAAGQGKLEIVRLLLRHGASLTVREPFYDGTPVGWADFFDRRKMRDILLDEGPICLFDALEYDRLDRLPDILARDPAALNRPFAECLSRPPQPQDYQTPLARMVERGNTPAVRALLQHGATVGFASGGRPLMQVAREKGFTEIADLLERQGEAA